MDSELRKLLYSLQLYSILWTHKLGEDVMFGCLRGTEHSDLNVDYRNTLRPGVNVIRLKSYPDTILIREAFQWQV